MSTPANLRSWIGVITALSVTILVVVVIVRNAPLGPPPAATRPPGAGGSQPPAQPGVEATLTAARITVTRRLPAPAFALRETETLDLRLPPGPFDARLRVTFDPRSVRRAALGARIQGGELTIERKGKVLARGKTGAESTVIMSTPVFLPPRLVTVTYNFRATGEGPTMLRALWRPQESAVAHPVATRGGDLLSDDVIWGRALFERLNCAACHASPDAELALVLDVSPAPILAAIGARARPAWIRQWLGGPQQMKRGTAMPALIAADADGRDRIEDLTHFLASLGGPIDQPSEQPDRDLIETGNALYHTVGCVACHGPLKDTGVGGVGQQAAVEADANFTPLGPVASKTTPRALAGFLRDPVGIRPAGYMPSQNLTEIEARAIASYLIHLDSKTPPAPPAPSPELNPDPDRVQRGREFFATTGCANCHSLGPEQPSIQSRLAAPDLDGIVARAIEPAGEPGGCLARRPPPGAADFSLTAGQRRSLIAFLGSLAVRRSLDAPLDQLAAALSRLNCLACHEFHGTGGPGPLTNRYHVTNREVDLGDEGRLPPDLTDVGGRLNPQWLTEVLVNGATARGYQSTRMPQFGQANVDRLTYLFAAAAGVRSEPDTGPSMTADETETGRALVGSRGFNCISCHSIAGRASTNLPGPDLVQMAERLRWGYFRSWMHDPKTLRPTTRMPSFFFDGKSGLREHFAGDADRQVTAMWHYLSLGESLPLPDGLADPGGLELAVEDEPIVFRTFMKEVGPRAIACGFPEQIHYAFDAANCVLRLVWTGRFLRAAGAWGARGGSETDPQQEPIWRAPDSPVFGLATTADSIDSTAFSWAEQDQALRWRGYRLDSLRRPIFQYEVRVADVVVEVSEQPIPRRDRELAILNRRFELRGAAGTRVLVNLPDHRLVDSDSQWTTLDGGVREFLLDRDGKASFDLELVLEPDS